MKSFGIELVESRWRFGALTASGLEDRSRSQRASLQGQTLDVTVTLDRFHLASRRSRVAPGSCRWLVVSSANGGVKPVEPAKPRLHRDLGHRQARLVDEPFGPLHPCSPDHLRGTCLQVTGEYPRQLPCPHTETRS